MDKIKDNKTEKLLGTIYKAYDLLRGPLHTSEAFKIVFALLYYKRVNDILEKGDEFEYFEPNDVSAECLLPEENRWHHLLNTPPHQIFEKISNNIKNIACLNAEGSISLSGIDEALSFQTYQAKIPHPIQQQLVNLFNSQDLSFREIPYIKFQEVVMKFESKCRNNSESYIHPSLNKLMMGILCPGDDETVYIPLCGFGEAANLLIDHIYDDEYIINAGGNYVIELNVHDLEILALIKLRLSTAIISNAKLMKEYKRLKPITIINFDEKMETDVVFINPPFGKHLPVPGTSHEMCYDSSLYEFWGSFKKINKGTLTGIVIPSSFLSDKEYVDVRRNMIEGGWIEAIISLPENLYGPTPMPIVMLILNINKPKSRKQRILFTNANPTSKGETSIISDKEIDRTINAYRGFKIKDYEDVIVDLREIQQQNFNLSPDLYVGALSKEIEELVETQTGRSLESICDVSRGRSRSPDTEDCNGLPYITTKDLAKDVIDQHPGYDKCLLGMVSSNDIVFDKKCILVSLVGNALKPTIFDPETANKSEPDQNGHLGRYRGVLLGHNIGVIIPNEEIVDFEYLYYQLYSALVKKQFEVNLSGTGLPRLSMQSLKLFVIPLLKSLDEQRTFINQQKQLLLDVENAKFEAVKAKLGFIEKKQEAEFEIVRHLAHDIKPKINIVGSPLRTISAFLNKEGLLDKEVSVRLDGTNETAREAINFALAGLSQIADVLDSARDIVTREIKRDEFQKTNIVDLFEKNIMSSYDNKPYRITIDCKDKELDVILHVESFVEAINNIIRNAETHAFSGDIANPELRFEINEDVNEETVIIDYTNNGHRFPSSMQTEEFLSFGKKSSDSEGEGLGGAWIGKVIEAHDGSLEIIRDKNPVHFRITIPKEDI